MILCGDDCVAESEGFEPPIPFRVCRFSRPVPSTTRPTLRLKAARSSAACRQADDATHISLHASPIASRDWPLGRRFALRRSQRCGGSSGIARWEPYSYMRFDRPALAPAEPRSGYASIQSIRKAIVRNLFPLFLLLSESSRSAEGMPIADARI